MPNDCLLLIVHGSRDPQWSRSFYLIEQQLRHKVGVDRVYLTFMEINSPTLADIVIEKRNQGILTFKVLPLFMSSGGHVDRDIPAQITALKTQFPDIQLIQLPPIGEDPRVVSAILEIGESALFE